LPSLGPALTLKPPRTHTHSTPLCAMHFIQAKREETS